MKVTHSPPFLLVKCMYACGNGWIEVRKWQKYHRQLVTGMLGHGEGSERDRERKTKRGYEWTVHVCINHWIIDTYSQASTINSRANLHCNLVQVNLMMYSISWCALSLLFIFYFVLLSGSLSLSLSVSFSLSVERVSFTQRMKPCEVKRQERGWMEIWRAERWKKVLFLLLYYTRLTSQVKCKINSGVESKGESVEWRVEKVVWCKGVK